MHFSIPTNIARIVNNGLKQLNYSFSYAPRNPFLEGAYAPVSQERTDENLEVIGSIPKELNGIFARIGPNPVHAKNPSKHHWFFGDGMVHGIKLSNGECKWYKNRWIGTDSVNDALGIPRAPGIKAGIVDVVNTNIIKHGGRIWALVEAGALPIELDENLNTIHHGLFNSKLKTSFTAHPRLDPKTGELHAITYNPTELGRLRYMVIDKQCNVIRMDNIPLPLNRNPMVHDCAITEKYVLVFDMPILLSVQSVLAGETLPYRWKENSYARIGLLPRDGTVDNIIWLTLDHSCYSFHTCNAFDQKDGTVVIYMVVHDKTFNQQPQGPALSKSTFEKWTLNPKTGEIVRKIYSDNLQEFPQYDMRRTTQPIRYAYTAGVESLPQSTDEYPLYKYDLQTGEITTRIFGKHCYISEPIFVPSRPDAEEDEGWLLVLVSDSKQNKTDFVIMDAKNILAEPIASIRLPWFVPIGFHSHWIED